MCLSRLRTAEISSILMTRKIFRSFALTLTSPQMFTISGHCRAHRNTVISGIVRIVDFRRDAVAWFERSLQSSTAEMPVLDSRRSV